MNSDDSLTIFVSGTNGYYETVKNMEVSIQQLRMLREVSRLGTIGAAAKELGYTSSAVSQQLSQAEKVTGVSMLERSGRNVLLTDAGRELVEHADLVLEQLELAQAAIERVQGDVAGEIRLGFIESIAATLLGPIMKKLTEYPELKLRTMGVDAQSPSDVIRAGELDISFVVGVHESPTEVPDGFHRVMLFRDWFRVIVPADHPEAVKRSGKKDNSPIDLASLVDDDLIAPPTDNTCGLAAVESYREAGIDPFIAHRVADYPTSLRLVAARAGVALIPDLGLQQVPDGVVVLDLAQPRHRTVELITKTSSAQRPAIKALTEIIIETTQEMNLDCYENGVQ